MGRTSKNIKFRIPEKPRKIKGFRSGSYQIATTISRHASSTSLSTAPYSERAYYISRAGENQVIFGGNAKKNRRTRGNPTAFLPG